jgi:hypothetical protein
MHDIEAMIAQALERRAAQASEYEAARERERSEAMTFLLEKFCESFGTDFATTLGVEVYADSADDCYLAFSFRNRPYRIYRTGYNWKLIRWDERDEDDYRHRFDSFVYQSGGQASISDFLLSLHDLDSKADIPRPVYDTNPEPEGVIDTPEHRLINALREWMQSEI